MTHSVADLSTEEFETLIERTIDRRMEVWLTQLLDALTGIEDDEDAEFQPDFAASLTRSLEQARTGQGINLDSFRAQLGV
jgi:hypothetical protein